MQRPEDAAEAGRAGLPAFRSADPQRGRPIKSRARSRASASASASAVAAAPAARRTPRSRAERPLRGLPSARPWRRAQGPAEAAGGISVPRGRGGPERPPTPAAGPGLTFHGGGGQAPGAAGRRRGGAALLHQLQVGRVERVRPRQVRHGREHLPAGRDTAGGEREARGTRGPASTHRPPGRDPPGPGLPAARAPLTRSPRSPPRPPPWPGSRPNERPTGASRWAPATGLRGEGGRAGGRAGRPQALTP